MFLLACILAVAAAAPATYDQRQDGELNVRADVQNVVFVVAYPSKLNISPLDFILKKNAKQNVPEIQERSDVRVLQAFVEPSAPYHVEIGSDRSEGDGRAVEVVIAGHRRLETEPSEGELQADKEPEKHERDELKLVGAMEQCGPDRERDPDTMTCRDRSPEPAQNLQETPHITEERQPEVVPASS